MNSSSLNKSDIVVGLRVKCVFGHSSHFGSIGTISKIIDIESYFNFTVKWDDDSSETAWGYPSSFIKIESFIQNDDTMIAKHDTPKLEEKNCCVCKRPNYIDCRVCWSCGNKPF